MTPEEIKKYESAYYQYNTNNPGQSGYTSLDTYANDAARGAAPSGYTTGGVSLYTDPTTGLSSNTPYVVSSANARGNKTANIIDSQNLYGTINEEQQNLVSSGATTNPITQDDVLKLKNSIGLTTSEEEQRINEAGAMAGSQYDDLIRQAEENKMQGMAKSLVSAGQRGGLMNTQMAGQAAQESTYGDTWFGTGGQLNRIKSEYDNQILAVQKEKLRAIDAAKAAARTAIRTGKSEDFQNATALYKVFQDQINYENELKMQQENAIAAAEEKERTFAYNIAKDLEIGQSYTDPATKNTYQGYKQPTVDTIAVYDNYGNLTLINKNTGEPIAQVAGVGKSDYDEKALVKDLWGKYPDAGITLSDTLESATAKLKSSSIYRKATRVTESGTSTQFSFSSEAKNKLLGANFSSTDIANLQQNIRDGFSLNDIISQNKVPESQATVLRAVFSGKDTTLDETTLGVLLQSAIDEDGNLDVTKLPSEQRIDIIKQAKALGYFDETDEETKSWFTQYREFLDKIF